MRDGAGEMRRERHLVVDVHAEAERGGIDLAREQREADLGHGLLTRVDGALERNAAPDHRAAEAARREIDLRHTLGMEGGRELRAAEQVVALLVEHLDLAVLQHEIEVEAAPLAVEVRDLGRELRRARRARPFRARLALLGRERRPLALPARRVLCHEGEELGGRRDEVEPRPSRIVLADAQGDRRVRELEAREGARGEAAREHVEGLDVEAPLRHDEHGIARLVRPDEPLKAHVPVDVREELLDAHAAAQHVLMRGDLVEDGRRAVAQRLEREQDDERERGQRAEHVMLPDAHAISSLDDLMFRCFSLYKTGEAYAILF